MKIELHSIFTVLIIMIESILDQSELETAFLRSNLRIGIFIFANCLSLSRYQKKEANDLKTKIIVVAYYQHGEKQCCKRC